MDSPFWHHYSRFDAIDAVRRHEDAGRSARAGYYVNYFGVAIDPAIFPAVLSDLAGQVEGDTLPADWHADLAEFGAAMRAVDLASGTFTVAELGCGWGCWLNITGAAARRAGLAVRLIGVEGDVHHVRLARQSLETNGFAEDEYTIRHGIAAAARGSAFSRDSRVRGRAKARGGWLLSSPSAKRKAPPCRRPVFTTACR